MRRTSPLDRVRRHSVTALAITGVALGSLALTAPARAEPTPAPAPSLTAVTEDEQLGQLLTRAQELQAHVNTRRTELLQAEAQLEELRAQRAAGTRSVAAAEQARAAAADTAGLRARTEQQVVRAEAAVGTARAALDAAANEAAANGVAVGNRQAALEALEALEAQRNAQSAATGTPGVPAPVPAGSTQEQVVQNAAALTGIPYRWGGTTPAGFDCSGYTSYVLRQVGVQLPRTAAQQRAAAVPVSDPQPGDLVFFGKPAYHVGVYAGNGLMYHSPRTGKSTELARVYSSATGYGRVLG